MASGGTYVNDELQRTELVRELCDDLQQQAGPHVYMINGEWGSGKTFFLRLCEQQLEESSKARPHVVQFNAWRDSYLKNPLLDLTYCLSAAISRESTRSLRRHARTAARQMMLSVNSVVAGKTLGLVNIRGLLGISNPWRDADQHLSNFKNDLEDIARRRKLILLIDELDRCEPLYALQVMEQVHHIFEVPNVNVVLAINQHAFEQSIQQMYGPDYDAERYIRRFVHTVLQLPNPPTRSITELIKKRVITPVGTTDPILKEVWDPYRMLTVAVSSPGRSIRDTDDAVRLMQDISDEILSLYEQRNLSLQHLSIEQFISYAGLLIALRLISPQSYKLLVQQPTSGLPVWHNMQDHLNGWFGHMYTDHVMMNNLWIVCAYLISLGGTASTGGVPKVDSSALDSKTSRSPFDEKQHADLRQEVVKLRGIERATGSRAATTPSKIELPIRKWASIIDKGMPLT